LITFYSLNKGPSCLIYFIVFTWQGFGSGRVAGVVSVRRHQELPPCPIKPLQTSSKTVLLLAKAQLISNVGI